MKLGCFILFILVPGLQAARFSTQEGVSVRYLGAIARTSRGSSRTTFKKVLVRFKEVIRSFSMGSGAPLGVLLLGVLLLGPCQTPLGQCGRSFQYIRCEPPV